MLGLSIPLDLWLNVIRLLQARVSRDTARI